MPPRPMNTARIHFKDLPDESLVRLTDVLPHVGMSRSSWYRLVQQGEAPTPVHPSPGVAAWPAGRIREWLRTRARATA